MIEIVREEEGTLDKPECWNLPEKRSYWGCFGHDIEPKRKWFQRPIPREPVWRYLFYTKEDAEASAAIPSAKWQWNKEPARQVKLADAMRRARVSGSLGIAVKSYQNGQWAIVKKYPGGVPLPEWELE